jgi:hypothetical protein
MSFGTLLLAIPSTKKHITGSHGDQVSINNLEPGELVLCFDKIDTTDLVRKGLNITQQCCDGIIFYAHEQQRVICLVEMKHSNLSSAAEQIKRVKEILYQKLQQECQSCREMREIFASVIWRAYVYRSSSTNVRSLDDCKMELLQHFTSNNIDVSSSKDITDFLRQGVLPGKHNTSRKRKR